MRKEVEDGKEREKARPRKPIPNYKKGPMELVDEEEEEEEGGSAGFGEKGIKDRQEKCFEGTDLSPGYYDS
uniref:Uncharacterized protein n=1 Tax=Vespula pensylvanica TaxID=30213 RepID=A0A834P2H4_VESPE|nr:hypothetical protein H0235_008064 [Vespula pensylvanica]